MVLDYIKLPNQDIEGNSRKIWNMVMGLKIIKLEIDIKECIKTINSMVKAIYITVEKVTTKENF